ncbi:hypothetical protein ACE6H2_023192 [Prunus campanulata]
MKHASLGHFAEGKERRCSKFGTGGSTDCLGPDSETVQKQIKVAEFKVMDAIYAGSSAFYASPPPSSVPLPAFLGRNGTAKSDLRRLLRLDSV